VRNTAIYSRRRKPAVRTWSKITSALPVLLSLRERKSHPAERDEYESYCVQVLAEVRIAIEPK